jgi:3-deoxy-D-arabino-heptulosonate 7-phosphate (DAHP) synthase class II
VYSGKEQGRKMSIITSPERTNHLEDAERLLQEFEVSGPYEEHYQPTYLDQQEVIEAVAELRQTETVTTPRQIDALQRQLTSLAEGNIDKSIIISRKCAEDVWIGTAIEELAEEANEERNLVLSCLSAIVIQRNRGQSAKPRSKEKEVVDGKEVPSFMGKMINDVDPEFREPDPTKMVGTAVQSRDLEAMLTEMAGEHVPAAHEALLLPYELGFLRVDEETGKEYLLSADLPWIGKRTNNPNGMHVKLLSRVENPVGIKIGPDSTPDDIRAMSAALNPDSKPGKLIFMLRVSPNKPQELEDIVQAIKASSPESLVMYDIHDITRTAENGQKIRCVPEIITDIKEKSRVLRSHGLKLHGLHLETTSEDVLECVDEPEQLPTHKPVVDPLLNPRQLEEILLSTKGDLL